MKIFNPDSKLMRFLSFVADLIILNLLTLMCTIPIITTAASFSAMHYVLLRLYRRESSSILRAFFHSFWQNLRQGVCITLIFLMVFLALILDYLFGSRTPTVVLQLVLCLVPLIGSLAIASLTWAIILISRYHNTVMVTIKTSLAACIAHPIYTLIMTIMAALPVILIFISAKLSTIVIILGFSTCGYLQTMIYDRILQRIEQAPEEVAHNSEEVSN